MKLTYTNTCKTGEGWKYSGCNSRPTERYPFGIWYNTTEKIDNVTVRRVYFVSWYPGEERIGYFGLSKVEWAKWKKKKLSLIPPGFCGNGVNDPDRSYKKPTDAEILWDTAKNGPVRSVKHLKDILEHKV